MKLSQHDLGFIEGVLDSEGCIRFSSKDRNRDNHWRISIEIGNDCLDLLLALQARIGGSVRAIKRNKEPIHWMLYLGIVESKRLLPRLNLIAKERQRKLALKAISYWKPGQWDSGKTAITTLHRISEEMGCLNKKGPGK